MIFILLLVFSCSDRYACEHYNQAVEDCKEGGGSIELSTDDCNDATEDDVEKYLCRARVLMNTGCHSQAMYEDCD